MVELCRPSRKHGVSRLQLVGACCTVDTDLPRIRYVMDPLKPVFQGTRRIRESRADE